MPFPRRSILKSTISRWRDQVLHRSAGRGANFQSARQKNAPPYDSPDEQRLASFWTKSASISFISSTCGRHFFPNGQSNGPSLLVGLKELESFIVEARRAALVKGSFSSGFTKRRVSESLNLGTGENRARSGAFRAVGSDQTRIPGPLRQSQAACAMDGELRSELPGGR